MKGFFLKGRFVDDLSSLTDKPIVLFPAGKCTQMLLYYHAPPSVWCVCDNDSRRWGTKINGIPVVSPQALTQMHEDFYVVITSPALAHDFYAQGQQLGIACRCELILCHWDKDEVKRFYDPMTFEDRRRHHHRLLIVLAGYKERLWDIVFKRIKRFAPTDMDVCVLSSGKYVDKLHAICAENDWSYLSTQRNNLTLIQNIAIRLHPQAAYIYKLDEDMFICEGFFEGLMETFVAAEAHSHYHVGLVAPLIPVNPHGNIRFMTQMGCLAAFEARFGKAYYDYKTHFWTKTEETLFLWEQTLPLDATAKKFRDRPFSYYVCPHRLSIGAILFRRTVWEEMGGFEVNEGNGLGADESGFTRHFLVTTNFYTFIMAENVLAGHYGFSFMDNPALLDTFYEQHKEQFDISENGLLPGSEHAGAPEFMREEF